MATSGAPPPFSKTGPVWYRLVVPDHDPVGELKREWVRPIIGEACARWTAVSPFDFMDMDDPPPGSQPPAQPDVVMEFGQLPPSAQPSNKALQALAGVPVDETDPRRLIFRDDVQWSSYSRLHTHDDSLSWLGRSSFLWAVLDSSVGNLLRVFVDLRTVTIHELGHVLGLGHNSDTESVMQPTVDLASFRYLLGEKGIPTVDVVSLDALYATEGGFPPITPAVSYAIVGGRMYAGDTASHGFKDDPDCAWGEEAPDRVLLGTGYGWNMALNARGYCHVIAHLMPSDQPDTTVRAVVGGYATQAYTNAPVLHSWGRATDKEQLFAKLITWIDQSAQDAWVNWYWYLDDWTNVKPPALFTGGMQRQYDATSTRLVQTVFPWGASSGSIEQALAQGRAYIDNSPANNSANGFLVGFLAP